METSDQLWGRLTEMVARIRAVIVSLIPADTIGGDVAYFHAAFAHRPAPSVADDRRFTVPIREALVAALWEMEAAADEALDAASGRQAQ